MTRKKATLITVLRPALPGKTYLRIGCVPNVIWIKVHLNNIDYFENISVNTTKSGCIEASNDVSDTAFIILFRYSLYFINPIIYFPIRFIMMLYITSKNSKIPIFSNSSSFSSSLIWSEKPPRFSRST